MIPQKHLNLNLNYCHLCLVWFSVSFWVTDFFLSAFEAFSEKMGSFASQGPKLRLTGRQCDQKLGVGDENFRTGCQQATNFLSPRHLKFRGKRAFFERKLNKTKRRFYDRQIYLAPYCFSGFSQYGYHG